jgi:hypothetical protein
MRLTRKRSFNRGYSWRLKGTNFGKEQALKMAQDEAHKKEVIQQWLQVEAKRDMFR